MNPFFSTSRPTDTISGAAVAAGTAAPSGAKADRSTPWWMSRTRLRSRAGSWACRWSTLAWQQVMMAEAARARATSAERGTP